jgi:hypothetical protein
MLFGKSNLGPEIAGLAYRIVEEDGQVQLQWIAGDIHENLSDSLRREQEAQQTSRRESPALEQACELIRTVCANGAVPSAEIDAKAKDIGLSIMTLRRARELLGIKTYRKGGIADRGAWMYPPYTRTQ